MATTFPPLWHRVKENPTRLIDPECVQEAWQQFQSGRQLELFAGPPRDAKFTPYLTVMAMVIQALHGNTALTALRRLTGIAASASAFCRARQRLPFAMLVNVAGEMANRLIHRTERPGQWMGMRVFLLDATTFSMPDTPSLARVFGRTSNAGPKASRKPTFPFAHALAMLDLHTGFLVDLCVGPGYTNDLYGCPAMQRRAVGRGDLLLGDRHFGAIAHIALALHSGLHAVMRFTESGVDSGRRRTESHIPRYHSRPRIKILEDRRVTRHLPRKCPKWLDAERFAELAPTLRVREVIYVLECSGYRSRRVCLHTTLIDAEVYDAESLADIYFRRWQIEVDFRDLKKTMKAAVLKGQSPDVVFKEIWSYMMAYNLVRCAAIEAGATMGVDPNRVSFIDAWRWLRQRSTPSLDGIDGPACLAVNPPNPRHRDPRVIKRSPPNYSRMSRPRHEYFVDPTAEEVVTA